MSNIVNYRFQEETEIKDNFKKNLESLYLDCMGKIQKSPEYQKNSDELMYLRELVISKGVEIEVVDSLIETAMNKISSEYEFVSYNVPDIFLNPERY